MSESDFSRNKARLLERMNDAPRNKMGCVAIEEDGDENPDFLYRAMKEFKEEGIFKEWHGFISPTRWLVRI
jgi:hypothetical protein